MSFSADLRAAAADLRNGLGRAWVWHMLAMTDIRRRFARSFLGPVWLTFNILLPTAALALIFQTALGQGRTDYFAYVAIGLVFWQFMQAVLIEGCSVFIAAGEVIRNAPLPLSLHPIRMVWRSVMVMLHNLSVVGAVLLLMGKIGWPHWSIVPALLVLVAMAAASAVLLGVVNARYRDLAQIVANAVQLLFFITPVFWFPGQILKGRAALAQLNPAAALIDIARAPLMGMPAEPASWQAALAWTSIAMLAATIVFAAARRRLVFWV